VPTVLPVAPLDAEFATVLSGAPPAAAFATGLDSCSPRIAVPAAPMIAVVPRKLRLVIILASFARSLLAATCHVTLEPA
jgi:hypothetical protein